MPENIDKTPATVSASTKSPLLPYSGSPLADPAGNEHVPNQIGYTCNIDTSGKVEYRYNSLGFRGEDYDENARFHIFVCGPSEGFGVGLNEEETWWHQFKHQYARDKGVEPAAVNLLNFSQMGASMDYTTRVLVSQCQRVKPDLVLGALSPSSRTEYFSDDSERYYFDKAVIFTPNMWNLLKHHDEHEYFQKRSAVLDEDDRDELLTAVEGYYSAYTDRVGLITRLKNILLLQQYCAAHAIPLVLWSLHRFSLEKELAMPLPVSITALADCIDYSRIYTHDILPPDHEKAADNIHVGADVNRAVALGLWDFYSRLEAGDSAA